nr:hypothetical protein [Tanacetum cinerariifolium]
MIMHYNSTYSSGISTAVLINGFHTPKIMIMHYNSTYSSGISTAVLINGFHTPKVSLSSFPKSNKRQVG